MTTYTIMFDELNYIYHEQQRLLGKIEGSKEGDNEKLEESMGSTC